MEFSLEDISKWIPYPVDFVSLGDYLGNRQIFKDTFPESENSLLLEQAILRERLRVGEFDVPRSVSPEGEKFSLPDKLRSVTKTTLQAVSLILDGLSPSGVCVFEEEAVAICFSGSPFDPEAIIKEGKRLMVAKVVVDFGLTKKQKLDLFFDEIFYIPIPANEGVSLSINCEGAFSLLSKKRLKLEVSGGRSGIIMDGRGRPFFPLTSDKIGRERMKKWAEAFI